MSQTENKKAEIIDLRILLKKILKRKKLFAKTLAIAFVVSSLIIVSVPRTYTCEIMLAPETDNQMSGGTLNSIASSFGFDLGSAMSSDAISPTLYPDLMNSTDFIVDLFSVTVTTADGSLKTNYYDYLDVHQKIAWWMYPKVWAMQLIASFKDDSKDKVNVSDSTNISPSFILSKRQNGIVEAIKSNISCSVDKKTNVITIVVEDQDKLICATMADSVRTRLQNAITEYRTNKSRIDMNHYKDLLEQAKKEYEEARDKYARTADANFGLILQSMKSQIDDMENDMQIKFNTYNLMNNQYLLKRAKLQERTPAFVVLQSATVPIKATGPKRMIFVLAMLFLTFIGTAMYCIKDDIIASLKARQPEA